MTHYQSAKTLAHTIIQSFPKTSGGRPFLTMKDGRKVFFDIFIKKYGLSGQDCIYSDADIYRRIKMVEFFEYMLQHYDITAQDGDKQIIDTHFFRLVIGICRRGTDSYLVLISFYDKPPHKSL